MKTRDLHIGYKVPLTKPINLDLRPGKLAVLLGPNGVGKTTLLRTLAGMIRPLSGKVLMGEDELHSLPANERAKRLSFLPGRLQITARVSVQELVLMGRIPHSSILRRPDAEDFARADSALEQFGLQEIQDSLLSDISDGEMQKTFMAMLLVQDCPVMLLDEPLSHLDPPSRYSILRKMKDLAKQRIVLYSSHQVEAAMEHSDLFYIMKENELSGPHNRQELEQDDPLRRIYGRDMFKE